MDIIRPHDINALSDGGEFFRDRYGVFHGFLINKVSIRVKKTGSNPALARSFTITSPNEV